MADGIEYEKGVRYMYFDKRDVYDAEVKPLIEKIFAICEENGISFTHSSTVRADEGATLVSRGALGCMNPATTDPYTRVNLAMADMSPEEVEMVWLALMTLACQDELMEKKERKASRSVARFN